MYLLLGDSQDPWCLSVRDALEARTYPARIIAQPMMHPSTFSWELDNRRSDSQLILDGELALRGDQIAGVFVRSTGWIAPEGWQPDDFAYMQAEMQAAALAWLWALACPVINRFRPAIWYRPHPPLLSWEPLLRRCGLPTPEALVTNLDREARAFRHRLSQDGVKGAVYGALTSDSRYLVTGDRDWDGLTVLQQRAPVCLTYPHAAPQLACVVGKRVIWDGDPTVQTSMLEPALRRFASAAGLVFVEVAFASASTGAAVIAVESRPYFEHFGEAARQQIAGEIAHLLTAQASHGRSLPEDSRQLR